MSSSSDIPDTFARWTIPAKTTSHQSLLLDQGAMERSLGDDEVLVQLYAASLNYRDLMIAKGKVPGDITPNVVPGSDGAGVVKAVGKNARKCKVGDRVVTHLAPSLAEDEFPLMPEISAGLGQTIDGTLQEYGRFPESALVKAPKNLSFEQAATLTCSGLTAWNALVGLKGQKLWTGDCALVEGTGGVSVAALQFAVAMGADVTATTSSQEKADRLRSLGAKHVLNYRETPKWGEEARELTPGGRGFDIVVDVGGDGTLPESLKAVRRNGTVAATGILGGMDIQAVPALSALWHACNIRGIILGTRNQFEDLVNFIEEKGVVPVTDDVVFELKDAAQAYERLKAQKHFSKVVIRIKAEGGR